MSRKIINYTLVASMLALTACGQSSCSPQYNPQTPSAGTVQQNSNDLYTLETCKQTLPVEECEKMYAEAMEQHLKNSQHYNSLDQCVSEYGANACQVQHGSSGDFYLPLMTGFMVGAMVGGHYSYQPYYMYRGSPSYGYNSSSRTTINNYHYSSSPPSYVAPAARAATPPVSVRSGFGGGANTAATAPKPVTPSTPSTPSVAPRPSTPSAPSTPSFRPSTPSAPSSSSRSSGGFGRR